MTEAEALAKLIPPGQKRPWKSNRQGVMQILVTSSCDKACVSCTQASNVRRPKWEMTPEQFEQAVKSMAGYFGVIGVFGGNPCVSPHFEDYCHILRQNFPMDQCGLWSNRLFGHGAVCRLTFSPARSNLNVHLDAEAYREFQETWPESRPFGLHDDSRHAPVWASMVDLDIPPGDRWRLISECDINRNWSAGIGVFRGELRGWFCEIAMAQSILQQHDPEYPDTGCLIEPRWWWRPMSEFAGQVREHCHNCAVPVRGYGALSQSADGAEQVSAKYAALFRPKSRDRQVEIVTTTEQLRAGALACVTKYRENARI